MKLQCNVLPVTIYIAFGCGENSASKRYDLLFVSQSTDKGVV